MKRLTLVALAAVVLVALVAASPSVQNQPAHIAFVDSQAAINAHPAGKKADQLKQQAQTEINGIRDKINALAQKQQQGQQLTPQESERYQTLVTTLNAVQKRYQSDIQKAAQPAVDAVNKAIKEVAQQDGYTIVLDSRAAGQSGSGLVVYADQNLDITPQVIDQMRKDGAIPATGSTSGSSSGGSSSSSGGSSGQ
ncbi:MAG: OmpH family outer membrane protein [Deinococcales bacterium]